MEIIFFKSPAELRAWLVANHDVAKELWIGFYKVSASERGITYAEALDEALCFGWIDGIRKRVDEKSFTNRFTPRKPHSNWSAVNIKRVGDLMEMGLMHPSGIRAFEVRDAERSNLYSFERSNVELGDAYEQKFRLNEKAWKFFQAQPPSYRKVATWWVVSAKKEETKLKRLGTLIEDSENGRRLASVSYSTKAIVI